MRLLFSAMAALVIMTSSVMAQTTPTAPAATIDPAKKALIMKFIDVFGTRKALTENLDTIIKQMPPENAKEAAEMRERIKIDEIIDLLVPVYDRNFTAEQLQAFINFYQGPDGQALLQKIPVLMQESVEISSQYMESKFPEMKAQEK